MKKLYLSAFALFTVFSGISQVLDVSSIERIQIPSEPDYCQGTISPDGNFLLLTKANYTGLYKYILSNGKIETVSNADGAGYNPIVLADGNTIVYRETSYTPNHLKKYTLKSKNMVSGDSKILIKSSRNLTGFTSKGSSVYMLDNQELTTESLSKNERTIEDTPLLSICNRQLMLTIGNETKCLSPNGRDESYIWPSLSPNGKNVLYYVSGVGTYTCNLDGSDVKRIGDYRAPVWYNDNVVVGMVDIDKNGKELLESRLYAIDVNSGEVQTLTDYSLQAMYPSVSAKGDKIAFCTPEGQIYIINVNVK